MQKNDRLKQIETLLQKHGKVETNNLCRLFGVSEMTIRRDLNTLAEQNVAVRSHGGAILPVENILSERPYELRMNHRIAEKKAIASEAIKFIKDSSHVFFDSSTTTLFAARLITNEQSFLAVTDTLTTAMELNSKPNIKVICLGGELHKSTSSCTGVFANDMLQAMYFDISFIGLSSLSEDGILSTSSASELSIKRTVIQHSKKTVLLVDSSKIGAPQFLQLGNLSDIDTLIIDSEVCSELIEYCKKINTNLIIVSSNNHK